MGCARARSARATPTRPNFKPVQDGPKAVPRPFERNFDSPSSSYRLGFKMPTMQRAECSRRSLTRALRRVTLAALAAAIVVSLGQVAAAQARCKAVLASYSAESLDTTLTRLQQRYDCSRSMQ